MPDKIIHEPGKNSEGHETDAVVENEATGHEVHTNEPEKVERDHEIFEHLKRNGERMDEHEKMLHEHAEHLKDIHSMLSGTSNKSEHEEEHAKEFVKGVK